MIEVKDLTKRFGKACAVDHISFSIEDGEVIGFLGPNGAGKSTTMNMITGYLSATEGDVLVDGVSILDDPMIGRKKIGYLPEQPPLYVDMTVEEYLNFVYELKGVKLPRKEHLAEVCRMAKVEDVRARLIKNLSKGYKQRVGIAQALIGDPEILILDEPTVGLDPQQIIDIRNMISELGQKRTIILSSHILPEVQAVCERVLVISSGQIVADDTPENLAHAMTGERQIELRVQADAERAKEVLVSVPGVREVRVCDCKEEGACEFALFCEPGCDPRTDLFYALANARMPIHMLQSMEMSLEEIFLKLVTRDAAEDVPAEEPMKEEENA